jgi:hypothetical protein
MRWRDVRGANARADRVERGDVEPIIVDRHGHETRTCCRKCGARAAVAWIFDCHAVANIEEDRGANAQRRLRAGDDQHVLRLALHCARRT